MPKMAQWPKSKVARSAPFTYVGLDYLGPVYIKNGTEKKKAWICLFTCITVRAIHLEVVEDITADQFLLALRRFVARRGAPVQIIPDNAKQFKATKETMDNAWEHVVHHPDIVTYVNNQRIKWSFIIELSPWMGGFYERLVGITKNTLKSLLEEYALQLFNFKQS